MTKLDASYERGRWQHPLPDGRIQCDLCPRYCRLHEGQRAFCFIRERVGDAIYLTSYGRATGFCIDPIEKKPLNHFYPGSSVLSFGTAGCNLGCKFCQNWDISKAKEIERLSDRATPAQIAEAAERQGCKSVAFTYNDPVIFAEYAIDAAKECHARGIKTVAVTAGYITPEARGDFFEHIDAANVDLKAFEPDFYRKLCSAELAPVLETLVWLRRETNVWVEVTTLLIPGHNDSVEEIDRLCAWFAKELGPDVPLHFSAFHPDFKMLDVPQTPPATCQRARKQALAHGIRYVYSGNIHDPSGGSTYCPSCKTLLIERDWYEIGSYHLAGNRCAKCGATVAGHFEAEAPNDPWGRRRVRVAIA
ncbi:MAG: AmmeMemoRadiSam system radical SAM enzyme [Polyangiaceae bacterium]|nr:AmmeMemoRadiSam system radical SAM enzyme [Polyangiaceae bacterium]MCE7891064.1 AmmeMemoRadiSam system radical SAM enzyme [Sorangiineae bacterium PRO1]MCL4750563.1 AmmeMemoRadiSam system radical SAM enzyme [Myxococcales bacterium]